MDGGLTEWGEWGRCDKLCEHGTERRYKTCTNPKPRCGGKQCDASIATKDESDCMYCPGKRFTQHFFHVYNITDNSTYFILFPNSRYNIFFICTAVYVNVRFGTFLNYIIAE